MELLQEYCFIALDIFQKIVHNKGIRNKLEAWLVFFSTDEPERIEELLRGYPEFGKLYEEIYELCLHTEKVMEMFSKELRELDRNTVQYMIDEMQEEIDSQRETIEGQKEEIDSQQKEIDRLRKRLGELERR